MAAIVGGWSPATDNRQGDVYAERVQVIAAEVGAGYIRSRSRADDWNDDLRALLTRFSDHQLAAFA